MAEEQKTTLAEGRHLRFVRRGGWEFVERRKVSGIVGIVARTADDKVLLTEQYRPPLGRRVIEWPAGLAGDIAGSEGEDLAVAAQRELAEETGYSAGRVTRVASGPVSAGVSDEILTFFRATNLKKVGPGGGDEHEDIVVHAVPLKSLRGWLKRKEKAGLLVDLKVYAGLYFLRNRR